MNRDSHSTPTRTQPSVSSLEATLKTRFITDLAELCQRLELPVELTSSLQAAAQAFRVFFPESLLDRVQKGTQNDPIVKQFLPDPRELDKIDGFVLDPLCEQKSSNNVAHANCILQKYSGRALVVTNYTCAARCRFCFRRHTHESTLFPIPTEYVDAEGARVKDYYDAIFSSIARDSSIHEIIFSGGDPLTLPNDRLKSLLHYIKSLDNVNRVRFHSRVPVLTPARIDDDFPGDQDLNANANGKTLVLHLTLHVNSPNELDANVAQALKKLRNKGYILTSQTVLLKGINDSEDVLVELFEKLADFGVVPYYLHQLDRVSGAAHFETPMEEGLALMKRIADRLPGYAVPKYVREIPGRGSKVNLLAEPNATIIYQDR